MEIQINNLPIDFNLEDEVTIDDLVKSIYEWIKERALILLQVGVDGKYFLPESVEDNKLENIELINFIVQSKSDMVISTIEEGSAYCSRAVKFIEDSIESGDFPEKELSELSEGVNWLISVLDSVIQLLGLDSTEVKYKDKLLSAYTMELLKFQSGISKDSISKDNFKDLFSKSKDGFTVLKEIFRMLLMSEEMKKLTLTSIDSPDVIIGSLKAVKDSLPESIKNIEEIAVAFQSGNDEVGSQKMEFFIQFTYNYIRTCYQASPVFNIEFSNIVIDDVSLEEKNEELKDFLSETLEALENDDIISLADILEYEIMPIMESLEKYVDILIDHVVEQ